MHGNSIGTPYHFFFSTGRTIDSGKAFGCVVFSEKLSSQPRVALFSETQGQFSDSNFLELPSYVVQTDSFGNFSFDHIRRGAFRIIAFTDANNDNRLQPGSEPAFAPVYRSISLDSTIGPVTLYPVACDTLTNSIISLKPVTERILMGAWARPCDSLIPSTLAQWRIQRLDSAQTAAPLGIQEYSPIPLSTRFALRLSDTMTMASYLLFYSVPAAFVRGGRLFCRDSIRFNGARQADTVPPVSQGFSPTTTTDLKPRMRLVWSKPVIPTASAWILTDSLHDTVNLTISKDLSDSTIFLVKRPLKPDRLYRLRLPDTLFTDLSGNHPRDTAFGKYSIRSISAENICYSLSGGASCLPKNMQRKWLFLPFSAGTGYITGDSCGMFRFDSISAGKGRVASFIDFNDDNAPTGGSLFPWRNPEPYRLYPDTIEARARWDIEGIEVPACEECTRKKTIPGPPDSLKAQQK